MELQESIHRFFKGSEPLQLREITFVRSEKYRSQKIIGRGSARLAADGRIELSCEIQSPQLSEFDSGENYELKRIIEGTFYTEDDYCSVEAMDQFNNIWHGDKVIIPELEIFPPQFPSTISCRLLHLHLIGARCDLAKALRIECNTEFAQNWRHLQNIRVNVMIKSQSFNLIFGVANDVITVLTDLDLPIPKNFEFGLVGALGFFFDELLDARLIERTVSEEYDILLKGTTNIKSDAWPVVDFHPENSKYWCAFRAIIEKYVETIFESPSCSNQKTHPIEYLQRLARQPEYAPLDGKIITACMVVEGIVELLSVDTEPDSEDILDAKKQILECLQSSGYSIRAKKRIEGALKVVGNPSAKVALYALAKSGRILETDVSAWNALRHKYAHLRQGSLINRENVEKSYNRYLCVLRMIKHMCFDYIGYRGIYTDYTADGFPIRDYMAAASSK